jgi:hypothetical protein
MLDQGDAELLEPFPGMIRSVTGHPDLDRTGGLRLGNVRARPAAIVALLSVHNSRSIGNRITVAPWPVKATGTFW